MRAQVTITFEFDKAMYMTVLVQLFRIGTVGSRAEKRLHSPVYNVYEDIVVSQHLAGVALWHLSLELYFFVTLSK